jgi:16S rRNA (guanine(527)-N(7))-methyltransferase GidB
VKHPEGEDEPQAAATLFGEHLPVARQLRDDLVRWGEELGLVGPRELERLWTRHLVNSALLGILVKPGTLADVGSGAGFPGLVVALMRPDVKCTLIEPMERRVQWLQEEAARLGLENVEVLRSRAQDVASDRQFGTVTARAVSALKKLVPMTHKLVAPGGEMLFMKGQRLDEEMRDAAEVLTRLGVSDIETLVVGPEHGTEETRVFRATLAPTTSE